MVLTSRELKLYKSVQEWEEKLHNYETTDLEVLYDQAIRSSFELLSEDIQKEFFKSLDTMLFHLHAIIQGTQMQHDASERILASARTFDSEINEIEDLKIATSEACTNAVQHAYKGKNEGEVVIGFGLYDDRLEVMVVDNGQSCNFDEVRQGLGPYERDQSVEFLREGGLGLYLIETLMDEVKIHQNEGVTVFMTKFLEGEQVESDAETISN